MIRKIWPKQLSLVLILALVLAGFQFQVAQAARPDSLKDVLNDSRPSVGAIHDIYLDQTSGTQLASGETVTITFPAGFDLSALTASDIALFKDGSLTKTVQSGACGSTDTVRFTVSSQTITFTACNSYSSGTAGGVIQMTIGGTNKITSPTAGSYQITVAGTYGDSSQDTAVAIISGVTVSTTIDETLTFSINAVTNSSCQTTGGTTITSTSTTVPFGTVNTEAFYDICQDLRVATNAGAGYSTTVQTQSGLTSGANTFAKGTCDGSCTDTTAAAWATATNNGYGYCMKDTSGTPAQTADGTAWATANQCGGGTQKFKTIANVGSSQTAQAVMASTASASDDRANIGWRLSADAAQAAGAYTATAVYITTPTF